MHSRILHITGKTSQISYGRLVFNGRTLDLSREMLCPLDRMLACKVIHTRKHAHYFKSSSLANANSIVMETLDFSYLHDSIHVSLIIYGSKLNT